MPAFADSRSILRACPTLADVMKDGDLAPLTLVSRHFLPRSSGAAGLGSMNQLLLQPVRPAGGQLARGEIPARAADANRRRCGPKGAQLDNRTHPQALARRQT